MVNGCVSAVKAFLKAHPEVAKSPEAAAALAAGQVIDDPANSATSKSMMVGRFLDALELLRSMAPDKRAESPLDEINARRDAKLGRTGATGRVRSRRSSSS